MFVDGSEYFDAFVRFAERAERHILILAWDFDSRMVLRYGEHGSPRETLGDFLNDLCRRKPSACASTSSTGTSRWSTGRIASTRRSSA